MCIVNIKVNDATMRQINPSLTDRDSITDWLQHQVDAMIEDVLRQRQTESTSDVDTDKGVSQIFTQDMSVEELYSVISDEIDTIYAK